MGYKDDVDYLTTCRQAVKKNLIINTIENRERNRRTNGMRSIANCSGR